jgi:hypothetical protein
MRTRVSGEFDPLRAEFVRSALNVIATPESEVFAADILFGFISGTTQTPLINGADVKLRRFLTNACARCAADKTEIDHFVQLIAAIATSASDGKPDVFTNLADA